MKQFKTDLYDNLPPFASCLYHKEISPRDQNFLESLRFTLVPYFQLYSFTFFWIATAIFVYLYSLYMQSTTKSSFNQSEFMKISQGVLFEMGENYPYFIVKKYHYYRLCISLVLFRNLYHFLASAIGIVVLGSYIEQIIGFKRIFLLTVISGVGGEIIRNNLVFSASLESLTPIWGMLGYLLGLFVAHKDTSWKYNHKQKKQMILVMVLIALPYIQLGVSYKNISLWSMSASIILGFGFYFFDPIQKYLICKLPAIVFVVGAIGISTFRMFLKTNPAMLQF